MGRIKHIILLYLSPSGPNSLNYYLDKVEQDSSGNLEGKIGVYFVIRFGPCQAPHTVSSFNCDTVRSDT